MWNVLLLIARVASREKPFFFPLWFTNILILIIISNLRA
jgi:hypothetical protein